MPRRWTAEEVAQAIMDADDDDNDFPNDIDDDDYAQLEAEPADEIDEHIQNVDESLLEESDLVELDRDDEESENDDDNNRNQPLDDDSDEDDINAGTHIAPSGREWRERIPFVGRRPIRNIFTEPMHGFRQGLHPKSRKEAFEIIVNEMLSVSVFHTNLAGRRLARATNTRWKQTNEIEMKAFIGLHFMAGVLKAWHRDIGELFSEKDGHPLFRASMSMKRFLQIKKCLRHDDVLRRDRNDKLAPIRHCVELLNTSLLSVYTPGANITIDEMLVEYHGRVSFLQYIPTKPGKFGIKIYWIVDSENSMPLRCLVYIGAKTLSDEEKAPYRTITDALVMLLCRPFLSKRPYLLINKIFMYTYSYNIYLVFSDKGRNLTGDNFFTNVSLVELLLEKNTSYVGTMRQNRRDLPAISKSIAGRVRKSSVHYYSGNLTLCSYWDKAKKPVLLLSSMHGYQQNNLLAEAEKPEMVRCYNDTKAGVDNLDKLIRGYRSKRKCRRWPYGVFFTLLDAGVIAALRLWNENHEHHEEQYLFKKNLAYELVMPLVNARSNIPGLRSTVKKAMELVGVEFRQAPQQVQQGGQGRCRFCPRRRDRKSRVRCSTCSTFICTEHQMVLCQTCVENN